MNNKDGLADILEKFITLAAVRLSDDVIERLEQMRKNEDSELQKAVYDSYFTNFKMAVDLKKPCCQDTGLLQFYVKAGTKFPYLDDISEAIEKATVSATKSVPLRPNAVNYFDDKNTGDNTGERTPWIDWEPVPASDQIEITLYFSGAGCSLPAQAKVFKPSDGIEAIIPFVHSIVTGAGINACPPLLVGVGLGHNIDNAAALAKKACLRLLGTRHPHPKGAEMENTLLEGLNKLGIGAQGLKGKQVAMGVHVESSARHTATRACAVNLSCYVLRRGIIKIKSDLSYELPTYKDALL